MRIIDSTFSLSSPTLWVVLLGGFASNLIQYGSDQTVIQRYLTTKDEKSAAKGIWIGAWMTIPATFIFFTLGTLLFVFYKEQPEALNFTLEKTDAIFPWYIVSNLPDGISGLLIAAIFAASMSSLDSSMNSVSTVITTDFFRRLRPLPSEEGYLKIARITTAIVGIVGTAFALVMASWGISSLWDQFNMIVGLFTGGLGGIFILGIFVKKANGTGAIAGLLISGVFQFLIKEFTDIHLLLYAFTGMIISLVFAYIISVLTGGANESGVEWTMQAISKSKTDKN
jgi:Na+/proline symporter